MFLVLVLIVLIVVVVLLDPDAAHDGCGWGGILGRVHLVVINHGAGRGVPDSDPYFIDAVTAGSLAINGRNFKAITAAFIYLAQNKRRIKYSAFSFQKLSFTANCISRGLLLVATMRPKSPGLVIRPLF
jgi:hypothetical protein